MHWHAYRPLFAQQIKTNQKERKYAREKNVIDKFSECVICVICVMHVAIKCNCLINV